MNHIMSDLVKTILYFDIFAYPLTRDELIAYTGIDGQDAEIALEKLDQLVIKGLLSYSGGFYFMGNRDALVERRIQGNQRAQKRMKAARFYSGIIARFPFVESVMLSGSIAKGYMGKNDDIDYFIVTKPGRLWLVRSMLVLFKKIFLQNSYRNFCINYFVDSDHLEIRDRNRFTATEIAFLIPMFNRELHARMIAANSWVREYYPNPVFHEGLGHENKNFLTLFVEVLFDNRLGEVLDRYLIKLSTKIIRKKFGHMRREDFHRCFSIKRNELRYLPTRQQQRILKRLCWKMKLFERKTGNALFPEVHSPKPEPGKSFPSVNQSAIPQLPYVTQHQ